MARCSGNASPVMGRINHGASLTSLPTHDILIDALSAFATVGTVGEDFVIAMFTRTAVNVGMSPGIHGQVFGKIGAVRVFRSRRPLPECLESLVGCRKVADVESVRPDRRL